MNLLYKIVDKVKNCEGLLFYNGDKFMVKFKGKNDNNCNLWR
jgi:hypothetical protein